MIGRRGAWLLAILALTSACARGPGPIAQKDFEFDKLRVRATVPAGWEAIDHGSQKRFRKGEYGIVLQTLRPVAPLGLKRELEPGNQDEMVEWGLAELGHDQRREVKSRRTVTIDGREAIDIETWQRLDHTFPLRALLVPVGTDDLLVLHTERIANEESLKAFDVIRDSLHFVVAAPAGSARR